MKINAGLWYVRGVSMNRMTFLLRVAAQAVLDWIRTFAKKCQEKPAPTGSTRAWERDAMWHDLKTKRRKRWIWKALDRETRQ